MREVVFDIEATNLLNTESIDYSSLPYKLKPDYKVHCIVAQDINTGEKWAFYDEPTIPFKDIKYTHHPISEWREFVKGCKRLIGHNIINFDMLCLKLYLDIPYTIYPDTVGGNKCAIEDTLVMSRLLNPDRFGGHSLASFGQRIGLSKIDYQGGWEAFNEDMLYYCFRDVDLNVRVWEFLKEEWGSWNWGNAYQLEKAVVDIITRQEHTGFSFDKELAEKCYKELCEMMDDIEKRVEPRLPMKPITKTAAKEYTPPNVQFKKSGEMSANMEKWLEKHGGEIIEKDEMEVGVRKKSIIFLPKRVKVYGKEYSMPMCPDTPVVSEVPMKLSDQTELKQYIISLGWNPNTWKEKDLTIDTKKKKLDKERYEEAVERYTEDTLGTPFEKFRCEFLGCEPEQLRERLLSHDGVKPLKVYTSPSFTIDADKNLCPNLEALGEQVDFVQDIVKWLTYRHRRNSILSPATEDNTKKEDTGWLAHPRIEVDGRIPTPANTLGAVTRRFTHKEVANIPRVTSLYGDKMRSLFKAPKCRLVLGMDFDALEKKVEAHYTRKYPGGDEYIQKIMAPKPLDCHEQNSRKLGISRNEAKTVAYAVSYGAQPPKLAQQQGWSLQRAQQVFNDFWEESKPLADLKKDVEKFWQGNGGKKFIVAIDGAKLWSRSKHSLVNLLFQSCGVICAKRAMVWLDRKIQEEGLDALQLIQMHDELQLEINADDVKWKLFSSEDEAKEWKASQEKATGKIFSDVGHVGDKFYVAYHRAGELAALSAKYASEYYKLNVPLTAGYQIGRTWAETH